MTEKSDSFKDVVHLWRIVPRDGRAAVLEGAKEFSEFCEKVFGPEDASERHWFRACSRIVSEGKMDSIPAEVDQILQWLKHDPRRVAVAIAHIECARHLLEHPWRADQPLPLPSLDLPKGFLRLLAQQLSSPGTPMRCARQMIGLPLISKTPGEPEDKWSGVMADLILDLVPEGTGELYPSVALSLVAIDREFQDATDYAKTLLKDIWPDDVDLCWSIRLRMGKLPTEISGPSAGLAFFLAGGQLLASHREQVG